MTQDDILPIVLIALMVVGALYLGGQLGLFSLVGFEDSIIYDDFTVPDTFSGCTEGGTSDASKNCPGTRWNLGKGANQNTGGSAGYTFVDGGLDLSASNQASAGITSTFDFKEKDIRIVGNTRVSNGGFVEFTLSGLTIYKTSGSQSFTITITRSILNKDQFIVNVNGDESTFSMSSSTPQFLGIVAVSPQKTISASVFIDEVRYRYFFSCNVEADEVVIADDFTAGSTFNINSLTYPPVKFCLDSYPAVLRSITTEGVRADLRGEITRTLASGGSVTVPADSTISVHYIADFKEGITLRCPLDSAYSTSQNKCVKIISEAPDIISPVPTIIPPQLGPSDIPLRAPASYGDKTIENTKPVFKCSSETNSATAPNPRPECWEVSSIFGTLVYGQTKNINPYFDVKWITNAQYNNGVQDGFETTFILTPRESFLKTTPKTQLLTESDFFVNLGSAKSFEIDIDNKLDTGFPSAKAGYSILIKKDLIGSQETQVVNTALPIGKKTVSINVDTTQLGKITYQVTPFAQINPTFTGDTVIYQFFIFNDIKQTEGLTLTNITGTTSQNTTTLSVPSTSRISPTITTLEPEQIPEQKLVEGTSKTTLLIIAIIIVGGAVYFIFGRE